MLLAANVGSGKAAPSASHDKTCLRCIVMGLCVRQAALSRDTPAVWLKPQST